MRGGQLWAALAACLAASAPGAIAGSSSGARRLAEGGCDLQQVQLRMQQVNAECCDEPGEDCTSSFPSICNADCAAVFTPVRPATFLGPESAQRTGSPRLPLLTPSPRRVQLRAECANVIENQLHELVPEFDRFQAKCEAPVGAEATSGGSKADWGTLQTLEDIQNLRDEVAYLRAKDIQKERRITALEASVAQLLSAPPPPAGAPPNPPAPPPPPAEVVCTEGTAIPYSDRSEENPCSGTAGTVCEFTCDEHFVKACEQRAEDGSCAREAPHICGEDGTFSGGESTAAC